MPRKKRVNAKSSQSSSDVTIHDYANAPKLGSRPKKYNKISAHDHKWENQHYTDSKLANATVGVEKEKLMESADDTWEHRSYSDVELEEKEDTDGNKIVILQNRRSKSAGQLKINTGESGKVYPEILYYLISKYLRPEDVGRFAGINTITYALTKRESFWRALYVRYCRPKNYTFKYGSNRHSLRMDYGYGLKQRVVRTLHLQYPPFWKRGDKYCHEPRELVGRRCVILWHSPVPKGSGQYYYLKLKSAWSKRPPRPALLRLLDDVDANPEEHTRVMRVESKSVQSLPPVMGMLLVSVATQLVQSFTRQRLCLGFAHGQQLTQGMSAETSLIIEDVQDISIFDWWHPHYPPFEVRVPTAAEADEDAPTLLKQTQYHVHDDFD